MCEGVKLCVYNKKVRLQLLWQCERDMVSVCVCLNRADILLYTLLCIVKQNKKKTLGISSLDHISCEQFGTILQKHNYFEEMPIQINLATRAFRSLQPQSGGKFTVYLEQDSKTFIISYL